MFCVQIRRWAINTVKSLGPINWDDYDDLHEVITWLVKVVVFDLFSYPVEDVGMYVRTYVCGISFILLPLSFIFPPSLPPSLPFLTISPLLTPFLLSFLPPTLPTSCPPPVWIIRILVWSDKCQSKQEVGWSSADIDQTL